MPYLLEKCVNLNIHKSGKHSEIKWLKASEELKTEVDDF